MSSSSLLLPAALSPLSLSKTHRDAHDLPTKAINPPSFRPLSHPPPSISLYNSLIRSHIDSHQPNQALSLFHHLLCHALLPDNFTFPLVLKACARLSALSVGQQIHCMLLKAHFIPSHDIFIHTSLITMYAECGSIDDAYNLFDRIPDRNTVTWNSMVAGFAKCGDMNSALRCFREMPPPMRNIISWNSLLAGYTRENMPREALLLFIEMLQFSGQKPDESTITSLVPAVSDLGLLELGRRAHGFAARNLFSLDGALGVALITMYCRCGCIDAAYKLFLTIDSKNVGHWSCMIGGFANHGLSEAALQVFDEMLRSGIRPNRITFVGVLNACRHAGLVKEGFNYFNLMRSSFDIEPRIEHYGCLVDLLARAGRVEEALEFACSLPAKEPGFVVWCTLLAAACRNRGNVEVAEFAANKLIEIEPESGGAYVLLSNLYAKLGRWGDCTRIREMMARRVFKVPGFSWIEVDGRVHEFVAGGRIHAKTSQIYSILEEIQGNLTDKIGSVHEKEQLYTEY